MKKTSAKSLVTKNKELDEQLKRRQCRFRVLVCINGEDASYEGVKLAAKLCETEVSDIVLLYVRRIDQGMNAGGLQVRVARRNLLEWGLELPGIKYLKRGFDMLLDLGFLGDEWEEHIGHTDVFGDPLGDNKVEYRGKNGRRIVLKLKTAPDISGGILHQHELGPYNMVLMGPHIQWTTNWRSLFVPNVVQKVASLTPATVMTVRDTNQGNGFLLSTDGSPYSVSAKKRGAVVAYSLGEHVRVLGTADDDSDLDNLQRNVDTLCKDLKESGIVVDDCNVIMGDPVRATVEAGNSCAAIVVSDRQTTRFNRFFTGSIAFDIMQLSTTSVLNVR